MAKDDWPAHGEELARKVLSFLEDRIEANANGEFSNAALWLVANALADVTQGLIPDDAWKMIYEIRQQLAPTLKRKT